jgi:hypothetical protein
MPGAFTQFILPTFDLHTGYKQKNGKKLKHKRSIFTTSKKDHQSLRLRISVMKIKNSVFVDFKTKHELKCQFSGNTSPLLRFFDELFDVLFDNPFLTL